jgi:hypothetical protein
VSGRVGVRTERTEEWRGEVGVQGHKEGKRQKTKSKAKTNYKNKRNGDIRKCERWSRCDSAMVSAGDVSDVMVGESRTVL